jgi:putative hydrolase of the HAD superfamily
MGGVILSSNIEFILTELAKEFKIPVEDLLEYRRENKEKLWDGSLSVRDFAFYIKTKYSLEKSIDRILALWEKTYLKVNLPNEETVLLAKQLKKNYTVGLISNLWDLHVKINRKRGIFDDFDPCILSTEVCMHKPQKEIFELAIKRAGVNGNECVFIDDRSEYFAVAESLEMKTIEFKGVEQLKKDLKKLGVRV